MKKSICLAFLFPILALAQKFDVTTVPNPRPAGQWVSDGAAIFNSSEKSEIESILSRIDHNTGDEVALVTLKTIGEEIPKDVAVKLFNSWGIGKKDRNNGLLILLVADQRRLEMETGYGLEGPLPDIKLGRIQRDHIVPALKEGKPGPGFIAGLKEIETILIDEKENPTQNFEDLEPENPFRNLAYLMMIPVVLGAGIAIFFLISALMKPDPLFAYREISKKKRFLFFWRGTALFIPTPVFMWRMKIPWFLAGWGVAAVWFLIGGLIFALFKARLRRKPRICPHCQSQMTLLDPEKERAHETKGETFEEEIGALDYDIWICPNKHIRKDAYDGKNAHQYTKCLHCNAQTRKTISEKITKLPTHYTEGSGIRYMECLACMKLAEEVYTIATISQNTSSSSGGSSGGFSGGGGGSFGGGRSGGGGAGSSF